ncbi:AMP-binding protein [Leucobacter luti]|uniref:AMP-binding protein n=1 Tax=Leucobacter luti TaxID=340320 RepID=UPI003D00435B
MTALNGLRAIPTEDRAWLMTALADALAGGAPVLPVGPDVDPEAIAAIQREPLPEGTAVVVRTSGSSGIPKAVALTADALRASAEATHERFGGPGQWLVALPAHLISGLQMLVRSELAGTRPVFLDGGFDPERFLAAVDEMDAAAMDAEAAARRYVSLVPVQLSRLLDRAETDPDTVDALRSFDAVLVGGQSVSLALRRRAHELGVKLRRSYGMTETAGGCVYDGVEIGETRIRIRAGEVQIAGPSLAAGYLGDAAQTAERFITEEGRDGALTRWYRTGDAGELLGGMLTVTGRLDRVIISGGVNVSLDEVERVAREIDGWESAVALGVPHPEWGERASLVVEIAEGAAPFDEVRAAIRERLGAAAAPEWATELEALPRLAGGKPDYAALRTWRERLSSSFAEVRASDSGDSGRSAGESGGTAGQEEGAPA